MAKNIKKSGQTEKEDRGFFKKIAIGLIPLIGTGILTAYTIIKNPPTPQREQTIQNQTIPQKEQPSPSQIVIKKQPTFQEELKELSEYHGITSRINNKISTIISNQYTKNALEQILSETTKYEEYFRQASSETCLDSALIKAYITSESGHKKLSPHAKSKKGAIGPAQMLIRAAKESGLKIICNKNGQIIYDERRDPQKAIIGSAKYLKKYMDFYKDTVIGIASYNIGPGNLNKMMKDKKTDRFSTIFENVPETKAYTLRVVSRALMIKDHKKYGLNLEQKPSYEQQRNATYAYKTRKEENIHRIFPKPTKQDLETIKHLNPAILNLDQIPAGVTVYLPKKIYEPNKQGYR